MTNCSSVVRALVCPGSNPGGQPSLICQAHLTSDSSVIKRGNLTEMWMKVRTVKNENSNCAVYYLKTLYRGLASGQYKH